MKHNGSMTIERSENGIRDDIDVSKSKVDVQLSIAEDVHRTKKEHDIASRQMQIYDRTKKKYIVFACSFMQRILLGGFSAMISVMFVDIVREFDANRSEASLMQSLLRGFMYGGGSIGEIIIRRAGFTKSVILGCVLISTSLMASAFATNITTVVILIGVGAGCGLMFPLLSTFISIGRAFDVLSAQKYISFTIAGNGIGSVALPYVAEVMLEEYGWRGMCLLLSGIMANLIVLSVVLHFNLPRIKTSDQRKTKFSCDFSILLNPMYVMFLVINVPHGLSSFIESWYVPDYLVTIGFSREQGSILLIFIGAATAFGGLLAGLVLPICTCTRTKIIHHWIYLFMILAGAHAMFPLFPNFNILVLASVIYGTLFGMISSQCPPAILQAVGRERYPTAQALTATIYGISTSVGGVVAGSITDMTGSYIMVFYFAAMCCVFNSLCSIAYLIYEVMRRHVQSHSKQIVEVTHI